VSQLQHNACNHVPSGGAGIMPAMADANELRPPVVTKIRPLLSDPTPDERNASAMVCERCGGTNVYRMHAVWRCADCGFKTDCCGW